MSSIRSRSFVLLIAGQAINGIGTWAALVAMWGFAAYRFHSGPAQIALVTLASALPSALLTPVSGLPIDRIGPRRVLIVAYAAAACGAVGLSLTRSFNQLLVVAALQGIATAFARPASDSLPPRLVDDGQLLQANAYLGAASESAIVFGPLVAAVAIAVAGLRGAFLVDAATYLVGIAVVVPLRLHPIDRSPAVPLREEVAAGLRLVRATPALRFTMILSAVVFTMWGGFMIVEPLYVRDVLGRPASFFALLQTCFGVGLVLTSIVMPRLGNRVVGQRALAASVALSGVAAGLYVGTRSPVVAVVGVFLWGIDVSFYSAPARTLLQRQSPVAAHGRVLALHRSLHSVVDLAALPLTGLAAGVIGIQAAALSLAFISTTSGIVGMVLARRDGAGVPGGVAPGRAADDLPVEMAPL